MELFSNPSRIVFKISFSPHSQLSKKGSENFDPNRSARLMLTFAPSNVTNVTLLKHYMELICLENICSNAHTQMM